MDEGRTETDRLTRNTPETKHLRHLGVATGSSQCIGSSLMAGHEGKPGITRAGLLACGSKAHAACRQGNCTRTRTQLDLPQLLYMMNKCQMTLQDLPGCSRVQYLHLLSVFAPSIKAGMLDQCSKSGEAIVKCNPGLHKLMASTMTERHTASSLHSSDSCIWQIVIFHPSMQDLCITMTRLADI